MTVPEMIKYLILNYYLLNEMFTDRLGDPHWRLHIMKPIDGIELKQTNKVARCPSDGSGQALGSVVINQEDENIAEFEWKLKLRVKNAPFFDIGLDYATNQVFHVMSCVKEKGRWCCRVLKKNVRYNVSKLEFVPITNSDDTINITMRLHHQKAAQKLEEAHTLSFWVDGVNVYSINLSLCVSDMLCKLRGIDINVEKLRLYVDLIGEGSTVEIVDFGIKHR